MGGKCGPTSDLPVGLEVTIRAFQEHHIQTWPQVTTFDCGPPVWLQTADGIDLPAKRAIVVKSTQHFHAAFAPLAQEVLYVDTPGLLRSNFEHMDYRRRSLVYWPRVEDPWAG